MTDTPIKSCTVETSPGVLCDKVIYAKDMCQRHYTQFWRNTKKPVPPPELPKDLAAKAAMAKTTEDWQELAKAIAPVMQGVLDGTVKGTAGQVSLLKDILNRAYGKPVATQQDKKVAAGIVILPTLGEGEKSGVCPRCGYNSLNPLEHDSIKLSVKALYESL